MLPNMAVNMATLRQVPNHPKRGRGRGGLHPRAGGATAHAPCTVR
jgi:hypothetical protein